MRVLQFISHMGLLSSLLLAFSSLVPLGVLHSEVVLELSIWMG
jgi:hypothetical protein